MKIAKMFWPSVVQNNAIPLSKAPLTQERVLLSTISNSVSMDVAVVSLVAWKSCDVTPGSVKKDAPVVE